MKPDNMFSKLILLLVALLALHDALPCPASAAEGPVISIVTDAAIGKAAKHGFQKLTAALQAKDIPCEQAVSLDSARGKFLLVAGLASGEGPAARLLKTGNHHPLPQGPEALVIRRLQCQASPAGSSVGATIAA